MRHLHHAWEQRLWSLPLIVMAALMWATASPAFAATLSINTTSLPQGQVSLAYSQTLAATGGTTPYTWSITTGTLPAGLTLNAATGVISGTPTTAGTSSVTVQVTDAASGTATQALSIQITAAGTLMVTTTSLPGGQTGVAYTQTLAAIGGTTPYTWSIATGTLPAGLTLNAATGVISGTPTTAATVGFTVQVADSAAHTATQALSIVVSAPLAITTTSLPAGQVGVAYAQTLAASGGTTPYAWSITTGTLPAGLTLNAATGAISGTPTAAGTSSVTVQVADSAAHAATQVLSIQVTVAGTLMVTTTSLPGAQTGVAYTQTLAAIGGTTPYTWSIATGALPTGLTLNAATGVISGTPTAAGTSNVTVQVADSAAHTATQALSIQITVSAPTGSLPGAEGLCKAYFRGSERKHESSAFRRLSAAASDAGMTVEAFCADVTPGHGRFAHRPVFSRAKLAQIVFIGGTNDDLEDSLAAEGAAGAWLQDAKGVYLLYIVNGGAANSAFRAALPDGITGVAALILVAR